MSNPIRRAFFDRTNIGNTEVQKQTPARRKQDEKLHVPNKRYKISHPIFTTPKVHISGANSNVTNFRKLQAKKKYMYSATMAFTACMFVYVILQEPLRVLTANNIHSFFTIGPVDFRIVTKDRPILPSFAR